MINKKSAEVLQANSCLRLESDLDKSDNENTDQLAAQSLVFSHGNENFWRRSEIIRSLFGGKSEKKNFTNPYQMFKMEANSQSSSDSEDLEICVSHLLHSAQNLEDNSTNPSSSSSSFSFSSSSANIPFQSSIPKITDDFREKLKKKKQELDIISQNASHPSNSAPYRVKIAGEEVIKELDTSQVDLLQSLGEKFELLYNRMPRDQKEK
jgi:hypothetical protein